MRIYILRHAVAENRQPNQSDRERRLTAAGREELNKVVQGLRRLKVRPDQILASPYRRAWDTALVAARGLNHKRPVELAALMPNSNVARIWAELKKFPAGVKSVMLVGHEPLLTEFAAFLLNSAHLTVNLKKSGFIRIDLESVKAARPQGTLRWLLTPKHLARMA